MQPRLLFLILFLLIQNLPAYCQTFYFGNDLSYVNEMEDCGVVYQENNEPKDPYAIFADHRSNLVRLRLWHTPSWYDALNEGRRYSDLADVKRSIGRAKAQNMQVLLDFHLSDNWADPANQPAPAAWLPVADDLPVLKDSLYQYLYRTLQELAGEKLLPEMVQIGNETNKGILLSAADNAVYTLDWDRNAELFNTAIKAVRDVSAETGKEIRIMIHAAGPDNALWIFDAFIKHGVTDFDLMGISYYWAWHQPTTIEQTGDIIRQLREKHPGYDVLIAETAYLWTTASNDQANNIIGETDPKYSPVSPSSQKNWLVDLTKAVLANGGKGVIYWEPAWVSSACFTQWGRGSHQEHAAFFDFNSNLLNDGGIGWPAYPYDALTDTEDPAKEPVKVRAYMDQQEGRIMVQYEGLGRQPAKVVVTSNGGSILYELEFEPLTGGKNNEIILPAINLPAGIYRVSIYQHNQLIGTGSVFWR